MMFSNIRLSITIVITTANTLEYSRLLFAFESIEPKLPVGLHITSAATPDFHANPSPDIQDSLKKGRTQGIFIFLTIPDSLIPITRAISISFLSTDSSPDSTCNQTIGNTIKNDINAGMTEDGIQSHARIISAATGTERISRETGEVRILKNLLLPEHIPKNRPNTTAERNPPIM